MDSNDSFVTAASNTERPIFGDTPACNSDVENSDAAKLEGLIEASSNNPETGAMSVNKPEENFPQSQTQLNSSDSSKVASEANRTPILTTGNFHVDCSSTDESCEEYIARKWEQLGCSSEVGTSSQGGGNAEKSSESAAVELAPNQDVPSQEEMETDSVPEVAFLDSPKLPLKSNLRSRYGPPEAKALKLSINLGNESRVLSIAADETERKTPSESEVSLRMISKLPVPETKSNKDHLLDFAVMLGRTRKDPLDQLLLMRCML